MKGKFCFIREKPAVGAKLLQAGDFEIASGRRKNASAAAWPSFLACVALSFFLLNAAFAVCYMLCGPDGLAGLRAAGTANRFLEEFFFSIHTFAAIGYGSVVPQSLAANVIVAVEALTGLLLFALATGLMFARFARPTAKIIFSRNAIIAPYEEGFGFMFRIANARASQIVDLSATVMFSRLEQRDDRIGRGFHELPLERGSVKFFPLSWTLVHPIEEGSPLFGLAAGDLKAADAEFLVLLSGYDETFAHTVHARSSYKPDEVGMERPLREHSRLRRGRVSID